jgi:hypothetical protein
VVSSEVFLLVICSLSIKSIKDLEEQMQELNGDENNVDKII